MAVNLAEHLIKQLDFTLWANTMLADSLVRQGIVSGKAFEVFCHVLGAEATWASRCLGMPSQLSTWPAIDPEQLNVMAVENYHHLNSIVMENADNLDTVISYQNSDGVPFETPLNEIIQHMLLHGAYHRGQVNAHLRASGLKPVRIDYIIYLREGYQTLPALLA